MFWHFFPPAPALRPFVRSYMVMHASYAGAAPGEATKPMPPAPEHCLYFYPRGQLHTFHYGQQRLIPSPRSIVSGPQVSRVDLLFAPEHLVICTAFEPGGLQRLLGVPVKELFDFSLDSAEVLGPAIGVLNEQLANLHDYAAMVVLVEAFLLRHLRRWRRPTQPIDQVLAQLRTTVALPSIDQLAAAACLSPRQFERNCVERLGMGPKLYSRIVRFDRAFRLKEGQPQLDWLSVALCCGYYDYRHLVRDFQQFAGVTPPALLAAESAHTTLLGRRA